MLDVVEATCADTRRPATIGGCAVVFSGDPLLGETLQGYLESEFRCHVRFAHWPTIGNWQAELDGADSIFVDLRDMLPDEIDDLVAAAATRSRWPTPLIGICDQDGRRELSAAARRAIHGYLYSPLDSYQLSDLLREQLPIALFKSEVAAPKRLVIRTADFEYQTYCPRFFETLTHLHTVARHDVTILLVGETGTGKTTLARMVHEASKRTGEPLLTVACGALPSELIESELFGHVKGSFTGADRNKMGKFEAAGRGSILLDEIDVLGPAQQAKLLRVIETGEFEPVGTHETQVSQARIIVATNVELATLMERNEFRADLYYRLNVLEFRIPPLRRRPLDIIPLTLGFVDEFAQSHGVAIRVIHPEFLACLKNYSWPGNIRELKNHVRRAVLFCHAGELTPDDLSAAIVHPIHPPAADGTPGKMPETLSEKVACSEQEILAEALRANNFKRTTTAECLGISRVGLYKKMKKYGMLDLRS